MEKYFINIFIHNIFYLIIKIKNIFLLTSYIIKSIQNYYLYNVIMNLLNDELKKLKINLYKIFIS